jgi:GT2 family glycosyltransferase
VIVDNDPESQCAELLLNRFPELRERNFRYIVNRENIGAWGNFNRCIQMARGQWLTFLQDDDLLDSNYLQLMFASIDEDPSIDGIVCRKRASGTIPTRQIGRNSIARCGTSACRRA